MKTTRFSRTALLAAVICVLAPLAAMGGTQTKATHAPTPYVSPSDPTTAPAKFQVAVMPAAKCHCPGCKASQASKVHCQSNR